jgi:hypothetical protein
MLMAVRNIYHLENRKAADQSGPKFEKMTSHISIYNFLENNLHKLNDTFRKRQFICTKNILAFN